MSCNSRHHAAADAAMHRSTSAMLWKCDEHQKGFSRLAGSSTASKLGLSANKKGNAPDATRPAHEARFHKEQLGVQPYHELPKVLLSIRYICSRLGRTCVLQDALQVIIRARLGACVAKIALF